MNRCLVDCSLGFPVVIVNAPIEKVFGEEVLLLERRLFRSLVVAALIMKVTPLEGRHVKFIRHWMELNASKFGEKYFVSHTAVAKWEEKEEKYAKMSPSTEILLRMDAFHKLISEASFIVESEQVSETWKKFEKFFPPKEKGIALYSRMRDYFKFPHFENEACEEETVEISFV